MTRYFYAGLFVVAIAGMILIFSRTDVPAAHVAEQAQSTAEFGGVSLRLDYATTSAEREMGLGGRTNIPDDYGMLFVFPSDDYYGFWMNDMLMPIDMFWLDSQGHVVSIQSNVATSSYPDVFYPTAPARYVLETTAGFAQARGITIGTPLLLKNFPSVTE